jgi:hypothetical protein
MQIQPVWRPDQPNADGHTDDAFDGLIQKKVTCWSQTVGAQASAAEVNERIRKTFSDQR